MKDINIVQVSCSPDWRRALAMFKSSPYGQRTEVIVARIISLDQASPQLCIQFPPQYQPTYNAFLNALLNGIICTLLKSHTPPST